MLLFDLHRLRLALRIRVEVFAAGQGGAKLTSVSCHLEAVSGTIQVPLSTGLCHFRSPNRLNPQIDQQLHPGLVQPQLCGGSWRIGGGSLAEQLWVRSVFFCF